MGQTKDRANEGKICISCGKPMKKLVRAVKISTWTVGFPVYLHLKCSKGPPYYWIKKAWALSVQKKKKFLSEGQKR